MEQQNEMLKQLIQTLPTQNCDWMKGINIKGQLFQYQGFWYNLDFLQAVIFAQQCFKAEPTDIVIGSFPKSGTTWLKALAFAIATRTKFDQSNSPLATAMPHECIPFLEFDLFKIQETRKTSVSPLLATHIPYSSLPELIKETKCKVVYIFRDPKDVFVSLWHFVKKMVPPNQELSLTIEEACNVFCNGVFPFGPYCDHVLGYWKASLENPESVLVLKYEEMKLDALGNVKKLAEFMGYPFSEEEEKAGVAESIIKFCSFENLSNLTANKNGKHRPESAFPMENNSFFRSGKVGDWEKHFTAEMKEKFDQTIGHKLKDVLA